MRLSGNSWWMPVANGQEPELTAQLIEMGFRVHDHSGHHLHVTPPEGWQAVEAATATMEDLIPAPAGMEVTKTGYLVLDEQGRPRLHCFQELNEDWTVEDTFWTKVLPI